MFVDHMLDFVVGKAWNDWGGWHSRWIVGSDFRACSCGVGDFVRVGRAFVLIVSVSANGAIAVEVCAAIILAQIDGDSQVFNLNVKVTWEVESDSVSILRSYFQEEALLDLTT